MDTALRKDLTKRIQKVSKKLDEVMLSPYQSHFREETNNNIPSIELKQLLSHWKNRDAAEYVLKLIRTFGIPHTLNRYEACWYDSIGNFCEVVVKDESVSHEVPVPHVDFCYATMKIEVPVDKVGVLAYVSESIFVDRLKKEVTARCAMLIKNAITLQLVQEVATDELNQDEAMSEYTKRIKNNMKPFWFDDRIGESEA